MAHHNNTPRTVLDAPTLHPIVLWATRGANRAARRFLGDHTLPVNVPYRRPADTAAPTRRKARHTARHAARADR